MGVVMMKRGGAFLAPLAAVVLLFAMAAGAARAAGCTTSWNGQGDGTSWGDPNNWSAGLIPNGNDDVCINLAGTHTVVIGAGGTTLAKSLQLGVGTTGSQTLEIQGKDNGSSLLAELELTNGGTIGSTGTLELTGTCTAGSCTHGAPASLTNDDTTNPMINQGTIESVPGNESGSLTGSFQIFTKLTNEGSITANAPLTWSGGAVDNQGTISVPSGSVLTIGCCSNPASLTNDTGGSITNGGGAGHVAVTAKATYTQGAGTTSPSSANPAHPAVIMDNPGFLTPAPVLAYAGSGASAVETRGTVSMTGGLGANQSLTINGVSGCPAQTLLTSGGSFTNAGTLTLAGTCDSGLKLGSSGTGTLTNTGTLTMAATTSGKSRELTGGLINSGTVAIKGDTAFDQAGATLSQSAGSTTISAGRTLDTSGSSSTFQLQGGLLQGLGTSVLTGSLANTGGNVFVGGATGPGQMTVDGNYSQGSAGQLTVVIDGTTVGTGYSQFTTNGGSLALGGKLVITTLSGPTVPHQYTILGGGPVSGKFAQVVGQFVPNATSPTAGYQLQYFSNALNLNAQAMEKLQVTKAGAGTGTVTSSPTGINCGSACQKFFFQSQTVTLTAHPGSGWAFAGWSGGCTGFGTTCKVKMSQSKTVTAHFAHGTSTALTSSRNPARKGKKVTYTATVSPHPNGGTVKFTSNGKTISGCGSVAVNSSTGKATCSVTYHSTGSRKIQATYRGNSSFRRSVSNLLTERVRR